MDQGAGCQDVVGPSELWEGWKGWWLGLGSEGPPESWSFLLALGSSLWRVGRFSGVSV